MPRMTTSEALVETLVAEDVRTVFGIVGSAYMDALDLFPAAGIRFVSVAHEQAAAHAADGLARVTGRPQACIAQNGPGVANFVSATAAAFWAHSPVVLLSPETGTLGIGTGGFQELDQMPWFQACTKYQVRVNRPERMAELARRCFQIAKAEMGPTQLNIPRDYFYGEVDCEIFRSPEVTRGPGSETDLDEAVRLLAGARFPVILAGGGVVMADGVEETKELAEYLTAPVVNTYLHNDSFPWTHPLGTGPIGYCGSQAGWRWARGSDRSARCRSTASSTGRRRPGSSRSMPMRASWGAAGGSISPSPPTRASSPMPFSAACKRRTGHAPRTWRAWPRWSARRPPGKRSSTAGRRRRRASCIRAPS